MDLFSWKVCLVFILYAIGMTSDLGKFISLSFKVTWISLQSISSTSQIQFFFNVNCLKVMYLLIWKKKWTFPAILIRSQGT